LNITTRMSRPDESAIIHEVIDTARWGITLECVELVLSLDPQGYILGFDETGRALGVGFGLGFEQTGWLGHLVVRPETRGLGLGTRLFTELLEKLKQAGRWPIYLTATEMGAPLYAKFGFVLDGGLTRWEIPDGGQIKVDSSWAQHPDIQVTGITEADLPEIAAFDALRFGDDRGDLLASFYRLYPGDARLARRSDGELAGYVLGGTLGLGPFVAEADAAGPLFAEALTMPLEGRPRRTFTFMDANQLAQELCQQAGLISTRTWVRMILGEGCQPKDGQIFNMSVAHG